MAKRRHAEEFELPFVALMDTMTNVVGVLVIVLVMVGISMASAVKKVMSDLPPVDKATYDQMKDLMEKDATVEDAKKVEEQLKIVQQKLQQTIEDLKTLDAEMKRKDIKLVDLGDIQKKIDDQKKLRDEQKAKMEALLAQLEKLKTILAEPLNLPKAAEATYVRLPNPRPFPEKANITRIIVAPQGVLPFNEKTSIQPVIDGLEKVKAQLEYKEVKIDSFMKLLTQVFGTPQAAQQAWPEIGSFANTFQMEFVAQTFKTLSAAGLAPNKAILGAIGDISVGMGKPMPAIAEAIVAATKGDLAKWKALDPSTDPLKPNIKVTAAGNKISFAWGAAAVEVKNTPRDIVNYFVKDLAEIGSFKNRSRAKTIYDTAKIQDILARAASNPTFGGSYTMKALQPPGATSVQLALTPRAGGGETLDQLKAAGSNYQRLMRQIKGDPSGVAIFQVMPTAFNTYLEARKIADEIGTTATWEFAAANKLDLTMNVPGYEVQRFSPAPLPPPPAVAGTVRIAAPKASVD